MPVSTTDLTAQVAVLTTAATFGTLFTATPTQSGGTEVSGVTRQALAWGTSSGTSTVTNTGTAQTFSVPSGATVGGWGGMSASTGGRMVVGATLPSLTFPAAGSYQVTPSLQQGQS